MKKILSVLFLFMIGCSSGSDNNGGESIPSGPTGPRNLTYPTNRIEAIHYETITNIYPTYYGSEADSFSISPNLPQGLFFSELSGRISGTPEVLDWPAKTYTITATNELGSANYQIQIGVKAGVPGALSYSQTNISLILGTTFLSNNPSYYAGPHQNYKLTNFTISPALPSGIILNPTTGLIEGIATQTQTPRSYTITGSNSGGSISTTISISANYVVDAIYAGGKHSCAKLRNAGIKCWGDNSFGQLGTGSVGGNLLQPVSFSTLLGTPDQKEIKTLSLGSRNTLSESIYFESYSLGDNASNQLLPGDVRTNSAVPVSYAGLSGNFFSSKGGYSNQLDQSSCISIQGSSGYESRCWGGFFNSLAIDDYTLKLNPSTKILNVPALSIGKRFLCLIYGSNNQVGCVGENNYGQLGDNLYPTTSNYVVNALDLDQSTEIGVGMEHACAIRNQKIYCWGRNDRGQLNQDLSLTQAPIPLEVTLPSGFNPISLKSNGKNSCAININDGFLYCWGDNSFGQTGNNSLNSSEVLGTPVLNELNNQPISNILSYDLGEEHACILTVLNQVFCWGRNDRGQLGINSTVNKSRATELTTLKF